MKTASETSHEPSPADHRGGTGPGFGVGIAGLERLEGVAGQSRSQESGARFKFGLGVHKPERLGQLAN